MAELHLPSALSSPPHGAGAAVQAPRGRWGPRGGGLHTAAPRRAAGGRRNQAKGEDLLQEPIILYSNKKNQTASKKHSKINMCVT